MSTNSKLPVTLNLAAPAAELKRQLEDTKVIDALRRVIRTKNGELLVQAVLGDGHVFERDLNLVSDDPIDAERHIAVRAPAHYTSGTIECIDAIEAMLSPEEFVGFLRGQVAKYNWRLLGKDDPIENAQKAAWYLARLEATLVKQGGGTDG